MKTLNLKTSKIFAPGLLLALLVSACGGGSSPPVAQTPAVLDGTIQSGAAWPLGTKVVVTDSTGASVCDTTTAKDDGVYTCTLALTAKAPLVITATHDDKEPLVSVAPTLTSGTVNVNPATHAVAAMLVNGDPADATKGVAALFKTPTGAALVTPTLVAAQQEAVLNIYKQLAPDAMASAANPFTGKLTTDGKGMDAVLDTVKLTPTPTGDGKLDIAITTTAARADSTAALTPMKLSLTGDAKVAPPAIATVMTTTAVDAAKITPATAVATGTTGEINALLARMTVCYAQPQATRVGTKTSSTATAADIASAECKGLFAGNDPSKYKQNGYVVSGNSAFSGIFTNSSTLGVQFTQANYEYTVKNGNTTDSTVSMDGDVIFTAKWTAPFDYTDTAGVVSRLVNSNVEVYTARPDSTGKLFLIGNLSNIDASVEPRAEYRDFTHADFKKYSYINTGYNLYVKASHGYGKVVVTTPKGNTLTLKQINGGGYGYMGLVKSADTGQYTSVTTSVVRMAASYLDAGTTSSSGYCGTSTNHPRDIDSRSFWTCDNATTPKNWTDAELSAIADQGSWKFDIYTKWDDATPAFSTYRRTLRRAPTLAEIKLALPSWPSLTTAMRTQLTDSSAATGGIALSYDATSKMMVKTTSGGDAWQVPAAAKWAPRNIKIYGSDSLNMINGKAAGFDDQVDVYSSWRKAEISCSSSSASDQHCEMANGASTGKFRLFDKTQSKGAGYDQIQLNGYDARRVQNTLSVNMRKT